MDKQEIETTIQSLDVLLKSGMLLTKSVYHYRHGENMTKALLCDTIELLESVKDAFVTTKYIWVKYEGSECYEPHMSFSFNAHGEKEEMAAANYEIRELKDAGHKARIGAAFPKKVDKVKEQCIKDVDKQVAINKAL